MGGNRMNEVTLIEMGQYLKEFAKSDEESEE